MATNRMTRSKGEPDDLSLPSRTRQGKKQSNKKDGKSATLNMTFSMGLSEHNQQTLA